MADRRRSTRPVHPPQPPAAAAAANVASDGRARVPGAPSSHTPSPEARRSASRERSRDRREQLRELRRAGEAGGGGDASNSAVQMIAPGASYARGGGTATGPRMGVEGAPRGLSEEDFYTLPIKYKSGKTGSANLGTPVSLNANYVKMLGQWDSFIVLYDVQFVPDEMNRKFRREFLEKLMKNNGVNPVSFVYNGRALMYLRAEDAGRMREGASETFERDGVAGGVRCTVKHARNVSTKEDTEVMTFLNNVKNRWIADDMKMSLLGRAHYDQTQPIKVVEGRTEYHFGVLSANLSFLKVMMNVDNRFKVIRDVTILQCIQEIFDRRGGDAQQKRAECEEMLAGSIVITQYSDKPRTYRILGVDWAAHPSKEFDLKGQKVSLKTYYRQKYNRNIADDHQPILVAEESGAARFKTGQIRETYLIPELCNPTGLTDKMREDFRLMRQMADHTLQPPPLRRAKLVDFMANMLENQNVIRFQESWNFGFEGDLVELRGRVLAPASLAQGAKKFSYDTSADWTKNIRSGRFHAAFNNPTQVLLAFPKRFQRGAEAFYGELCNVGQPLGFRFPEPVIQAYMNDREIVGICRERCRANKDIILVIVILETKSKARYDDGTLSTWLEQMLFSVMLNIVVKQLLCRELPVISQCVVMKTLEKQMQLKSVATKIALQMGAKLGGAPWALDLSRFGPNFAKIMFIGVDTYHDSGSKGSSRAAVAVIGTLDSMSTQYSWRTFFQSGRQEIGDQLGRVVDGLLTDYHKANKNNYPETVIFYRDGVGMGQLPIVAENEVASIQRVIEAKSRNTKLVFAVVTKRHNTRFLVKNDRADATNPVPGTVVDTVVTKPNRMDFYIVAQTVRQGTVAPTYYNVLFDNTVLTIDQLQQLTYGQCCMYFNWSGTVKVPAQCQYAHKLAFLVGQSLHDMPSEVMQNNLFFL